MKIGKYNIKVIEMTNFALDGGAMFGVIPKPFWERTYTKADERNRINMTTRLMVMESDDKKILIDTGIGNKIDDKFADIYGIDKSKSSVELALNSYGINPDEITDVILTHLHFDHVGGATKIENGELIPTFKNAEYYVQEEQYKWAMNPTFKDRASFIADNYVPLLNNQRLNLIQGEGTLFDGIDVLPIDGHTKGMQMVKIYDEVNKLLYITDLCPTSAHILAPYFMGYDNFPLTVLEEKEKYLPLAYEDDWTIFFEHDAYTQAAKIEPAKKGFQIKERLTIE